MTGGLPTFIDVGSSFGSLNIAEDNLLLQVGPTALHRTAQHCVPLLLQCIGAQEGDDQFSAQYATDF